MSLDDIAHKGCRVGSRVWGFPKRKVPLFGAPIKKVCSISRPPIHRNYLVPQAEQLPITQIGMEETTDNELQTRGL